MNIDKMFRSIIHLQQLLPADNRLKVSHSGYSWVVAFEWFPPVTAQTLNEIQLLLKKPLPKDYAFFLSNLSNGAILYRDVEYGQFGFQVYSINELLNKQAYWQSFLGDKWQPHFMAIAESFGDNDVMVFDLAKPTKDGISCVVLQCNPIDIPTDWPKASRSFHEWLNHLVIAQGEKFWEWQ